MTRIENNHIFPNLNRKEIDPPQPQKKSIDQLINQIKNTKNEYLNLDLQQLKRHDANNFDKKNLEKLWTHGCLQTKGGVHCPAPKKPKPDPVPAPQPKPKLNEPN